jgi:hypothetical protein
MSTSLVNGAASHKHARFRLNCTISSLVGSLSASMFWTAACRIETSLNLEGPGLRRRYRYGVVTSPPCTTYSSSSLHYPPRTLNLFNSNSQSVEKYGLTARDILRIDSSDHESVSGTTNHLTPTSTNKCLSLHKFLNLL